MQRLNSYAVYSISPIICLLLFDVTVLTDLGENTLIKSSLSLLKAFFMLTNGTSLDEHGLFPGSQRWRKTSVSIGFTDSFTCFCSVCSELCVWIWVCVRARTQIASLCSESSPQIVQTSPSRLAGATAVTSPIHPSLDACQPGAARAVSMETLNKRARTPALLHSPAWRAEPWEQTGSGAFVVHLSP